MCGAIRYETQAEMIWALLCHCEDCQRAAGADYIGWFAVPSDSMTWQGKRKFYASSPGVQRSFCETCGTPMSFQADRFPNETHLYAPSLDDRSLYKPTANIFWPEHVPWAQDAPQLPRYEKGLKSPVLPRTNQN